MMRWAYQTPIKRASYYHSHDFCSEHWSFQSFSDKTISANFKYFGENREIQTQELKKKNFDSNKINNFKLKRVMV
jgi:hypothetical protein